MDKETQRRLYQEAKKEVQEERERVLIDKYKQQLKSKKWWHKLIPFTVTIQRR